MPPAYSLIIPAYNEQDQLARTLPMIRKAMASFETPGELIVVDNNSTDRTADVAKEHDATVVFEPVNQISKARNAGAAAATTQAFIFIDADTTPDGKLIEQAVALMLDNKAIGGGGIIEMDQPVSWTVRTVLGFWNTISKLTGHPAGCFFFCQREAFEQCGGFPESVYASEEIWLARKLRKLGKKQNKPLTILREPTVITSARKTDQPFRVAGIMLFYMVFPFAVRFRGLCGYWYKRPPESPPV